MKKCPYCSDTIYSVGSHWFTHLVTCDGTPRVSLEERKRDLTEELDSVEREIRVLTDRKLRLTEQIKDINDALPGQIKMEI